jgi:CRISPR-associated protein Cas5t
MPKQTQSQTIPAVHVHMEGLTAFFRMVWTVTASQMTLPCPSYANLLGLISACAGKVVRPSDTRIGFEFSHASEGEELERTDRFELSGNRLREQRKGHGVLYRQIHFKPQLDLYLTNLDLADAFNNPVATPCLGRSQDLCWITNVETVQLTPAESGKIGSTLISSRVIKGYLSPEIVRCAEWFDNEVTGRVRRVGAVGFYQAIPPSDSNNITRVKVNINNLYHPSNMPDNEDVIYLHEWTKPMIRTPPKWQKTK